MGKRLYARRQLHFPAGGQLQRTTDDARVNKHDARLGHAYHRVGQPIPPILDLDHYLAAVQAARSHSSTRRRYEKSKSPAIGERRRVELPRRSIHARRDRRCVPGHRLLRNGQPPRNVTMERGLPPSTCRFVGDVRVIAVDPQPPSFRCQPDAGTRSVTWLPQLDADLVCGSAI